MTATTDPARELAELCDRLSGSSKERGDVYLAKQFGVTEWSREFYEIVFCIVDRANFLASIVKGLELDEDLREEALSHIRQIEMAFDRVALSSPWLKDQPGPSRLSRENIQPIKMLSGAVREKISYPKLSPQQVSELLSEVDELRAWLAERQLSEQDFVRQALIDGIDHFRFRLERIGWLGWGYTIEALREVIAAYMALERGFQADTGSPEAKAIVLKVQATFKKVYEMAVGAKEAYEVGDLALRLYGAATLTVQSVATVAGLLPAPT